MESVQSKYWIIGLTSYVTNIYPLSMYIGQIIPPLKSVGKSRKEMKAKYPHLFEVTLHFYEKP